MRCVSTFFVRRHCNKHNMLKALLAVVVRFAVPHRNLDLLESYAVTMADPYHPEFDDTVPLSREAVLDLIVDPASTQAVLEHAETSGGTECDAGLRDWVVCFYPADKCPARGPAELVLLEAPHTHPGRQGNAKRAPLGSPFVVPSTLHEQYHFPEDFSGGNVSVGAVEFLADQAVWWSDVNTFAQQTNTTLPRGWPPHIVGQWDNSSADVEASLDVDTIVGSAPWMADVWHWTTEHWMLHWASEVFHYSALPENGLVLSMSWGWSEKKQCDVDQTACSLNTTSQEYVARTNAEFLKLAVRGVTLVASAGDAGAPGRTNEDCSTTPELLNPAFPAASPYVVAVGATFYQFPPPATHVGAPLCAAQGCFEGGHVEANCGFASGCGFTGGSGFSTVADAPCWQRAAIEGYLKDDTAHKPAAFNRTGRGYPDVTAMGQDYYVVADGGTMAVGGTSASAPLVAAALAHVVSALGKPIGLGAPYLYAMAEGCEDCFGKVFGQGWSNCTEQSCCQDGYSTGEHSRWNPVTGLGTPNVQEWVDFAIF